MSILLFLIQNTNESFSYKSKRLLNGVLYFHSIADRKVGGIAVRNLRLFQTLCGEDPLKSVVIVTNMWNLVELDMGASRETELMTDDTFFKPVIDQGARFRRHKDTKESAHEIIASLTVGQPAREKLAIQIEMVDERLRLAETSAAVELTRDFDFMIQHLKRKIESEERAMSRDSPEERKEREAIIQRWKGKIKELEERKRAPGKVNGSVPLQKRFLRWFKLCGV
jgi:hypothetical protein